MVVLEIHEAGKVVLEYKNIGNHCCIVHKTPSKSITYDITGVILVMTSCKHFF